MRRALAFLGVLAVLAASAGVAYAGHFSSRETYDAKASDGATVHYAIVISGAVRRRGATGTWQAVASGPYKDGGTYRCDTGKVTWRAHPGG